MRVQRKGEFHRRTHYRLVARTMADTGGKFLLGLGLLFFSVCLPLSTIFAQSPVTGAAVVRGSLDRQFSRHDLTVSAWDPDKPLTILLEYSPQGRWELDDRSGFFVFTQAGYENFRAGELPGSASIAAGDRLPGEGRRLQATIGAPIPGLFYVVVYNDSPIPMGYTLAATNGGFSDSGGQVIDGGAPAPAGGGDAEVFPLVVVPGPTPTPIPTATPFPPLRASVVRGLLDKRYAQDFFTLEVVDTGQPLTVEMIYDPAEQILLIDSFNFWIFDEDQFRTQEISGSRPEFEPNRGAGTLIYREGVPVWVARIEEPFGRYMLVVNQHAHALSVGYRLTVENGVLVDEGGQAQAVVIPPQPSLASGLQIWIVGPGDTLGSIAQTVYGDQRYATAICTRNGLPGCNRIYRGQRLILPSVTDVPFIIPSSQPLRQPTPRPVSGAPVANNLLEVADGESSLQTFRDLLGQTSLAETLTAAGSYTLFAFTNDAFDALPVETQDTLLIDPAGALALLSGHVVQGQFAPDWITRPKNVVTLSGRLLRLEPDGNGGFTVNGVPIRGDPIPAANGVIYLVDTVVE